MKCKKNRTRWRYIGLARDPADGHAFRLDLWWGSVPRGFHHLISFLEAPNERLIEMGIWDAWDHLAELGCIAARARKEEGDRFLIISRLSGALYCHFRGNN